MTTQEVDTVGTGRYVLNFLILGLIGVGIQYLLRDKGWTATWINGGIVAFVFTMIVATSGS